MQNRVKHYGAMNEGTSVKNNIVYNILLTISTYVAALIVYPYASRILGVESIGVVGFVLKTIDGFVIFITLGVTIVGIREIASSRSDKEKLSQVFSGLVSILTLSTLVVTIVYVFGVFLIPKLHEYSSLFLIGLSKLIASAFLIEWFYQGMEDFRYITIRNLILKFLYIISVFILVRDKEDYWIYFILNVLVVVFNALINWKTTKKYVRFKFSLNDVRPLLIPVFVYGAYQILNAVYSTFNYTFLGSYCSKIEVGYYYTAEQFYTVFLSVITAITKVLMPRSSNLLSQNNYTEFNRVIERSFSGILSICYPLAIIGILCASSILNILVGEEFEGATLPLQIMLVLVFVNGLNQIFIIQIAMPLKLDKEILIGTLIASAMALSVNRFLLVNYGALGAALVLVISVIAANIYPIYVIIKRRYISFPLTIFLRKTLQSIPYFLICFIIDYYIKPDLLRMVFIGLICGLYFIWLNKNEISLMKNR